MPEDEPSLQIVPIDRIVTRPAIAERAALVLMTLAADSPVGGITIADGAESRALVFWGPCPVGTDRQLRSLLRPFGYKVSLVRDRRQFESYSTRRP